MLEKLPHKNLFYFGFIVVFIFIGLSYWQLTRYQEDKQIIDSIDSKENINEITVSDLYDANNKYEEFTKVQLTETIEDIELARTWLNYDIQGVGQDDISDSEYLFRIDKSFIESETGVNLPEFYIVLIDDCGSGVECINLEEPYDAPHLSYAFQWAFFALCLTIVVLRRNNLITWKK